MENETLVNQIQQSMQQCEQQYNDLTTQMQQISDKFEELKQQREQVRGQYTAYYNMLMSLQNNKHVPEGVQENELPVEETVTPEQEEIPVKTEEQEIIFGEEPEVPGEVVIQEKVEEPINIEETNITNLAENVSTPEVEETEVEQIKNIVKQVTNSKPKKEDIPDYLQEEYNK